MNSKPETFASRLRELLDFRGITQAELSRKTGISKSSITHYLRGDWEAKQDNVYAIAYEMNISESWLMGYDVPMERTQFSKEIGHEAMDALYNAAVKKSEHEQYEMLSAGAKRIAQDFDRLDSWGKQSVRDLADNELNRMEQMEKDAEPEEPKVINLYLEPSAAGIATPTVGEDYEFYELKPDDPQGAAFAVKIQGDSMDPFFPDGSTVFVNHDALRDGDIGIFCVDGGAVCKQYHYDAALGMTYLFSLNRKRADCDVVITRSGNRSLVCQGRVITHRHFPVPGIE